MKTTDIISLIAIVISVLSVLYVREHDDNIRFLSMFNEIYKKTFELRIKLNNITVKHWEIPFYYEYDSIISLSELEEAVLDYLTELENFFTFTKNNWLSQKSLRTLVSYAFYQRTASLYAYILKKRVNTNNPIMFKNYIKMVKSMKNMKKIKKQWNNKHKKYYIGVRQSDVYYAKNYFEKAICLFGNTADTEIFSLRLNQNINHREMLPYYLKMLRQISDKDEKAAFYFYNQRIAYNYDKNICSLCKCVNQKELLDFLNNKLWVREWLLKSEIPVIPFETFMGKELLFSKLCSKFECFNSFVIQSAHGGGGIGTFYAKQQFFSEILNKVEALQRYIVSPYIPNISVNTHVFIAEKQTVLSPASIQIIESRQHQLCYRGGDFCAFQNMPESIKCEIKNLSIKIADLLRKKGYRGIAGIDFIIDSKKNIYCCEINPRFQASTFILDRYLRECSEDTITAKSCFELNEMAFQGSMITTLCFEDKIDYSCYFYYSDGLPIQYFKEKYVHLKKDCNVDVFEDGMDYYLDQGKVDNNSYLFRAIFPHAISKISPDMTLWVNDNIPIHKRPIDSLSYKIALLNQGIRIEDDITNIKKGVYESVDIKIKSSKYIEAGLNINCAYGIHLSQYSPYGIKSSQNKEYLYYFDEKIAEIQVEKNPLTELDELENRILFIATDRLRIRIVSGCENKNIGKGCMFCNVPVSDCQFSLAQIQQALQNIKKHNIYFRHILIGGGTCLAKDSWKIILAICKYLKQDKYYKNKPISIMTMLPPKDIIIELKKAGVEEVAFNLEIADDNLANKLMPAKRSQSKDAYYEVLRESVKTFGVGKVRSALLVGLDKEQDIYNEIITLSEIGVIPCLSAFRALPNTIYENALGPDNKYLFKVYHNSEALLKSMSGNIQKLGPVCKACRNNMLIL